MSELQAEIVRVQKAMDKTSSRYLRRDYTIYLAKLKKRLRKEKYRKGA